MSQCDVLGLTVAQCPSYWRPYDRSRLAKPNLAISVIHSVQIIHTGFDLHSDPNEWLSFEPAIHCYYMILEDANK